MNDFFRGRRTRSISFLLVIALAVLMGFSGLFAQLASGVQGDGNHVGTANHVPTKAQPSPTCFQPAVHEYAGTGTATFKQGRVTYSGPVVVKYLMRNQYGAMEGTISSNCFRDPDGPNPASGDYTRNFGPAAIESASITDSDSNGDRLKCQWDSNSGATFARGWGIQQGGPQNAAKLVFPQGSGTPVDGAPGTCTISVSGATPRVSNTRVVSDGLMGGCIGAPPSSCRFVYPLLEAAEYQVSAEPPPVVSSINAASMRQGALLQLTTISGKEFDLGSTTSFSGTGITVHNTLFEDMARLKATISIDQAAPPGKRDVIVTSSDGMQGVCADCFEILASGSPPAGDAPSGTPRGLVPPASSGTAPAPGTGSGPASGVPTASGPGSAFGGGGASTTSAPPPPPTPPPATTGSATPPGPSAPAPPGGTGGVAALVPTPVNAQAPVGLVAASGEEAAESAPEAGVRIFMTGPPEGGSMPNGVLAGVLFLAGLSWLLTAWRRLPWEAEVVCFPAPGFAAAAR